MLCEKCGTDIPNDAKFCPLCGALVSKANRESADNAGNTTPNEPVIPNESKRTYPYQNSYSSTTNDSNANQEQDLAEQQREFEQQSQQLYSQYSYGQQSSLYAANIKKTPFFDGTHTGLKVTLSFGSALAVVLAVVLIVQSFANSDNAVSTTTPTESTYVTTTVNDEPSVQYDLGDSSSAEYDYNDDDTPAVTTQAPSYDDNNDNTDSTNNKKAGTTTQKSTVTQKSTASQNATIGDDSTGTVSNINKVVYDNDGVKVTCTTYQNSIKSTSNRLSGFIYVGFFVENSSNADVSISRSTTIADGYSLTSSVYKKVPAGEKANFKLSIYANSLSNIGITSFSKLKISLAAKNSDTYKELFQTTPITISTGEKAATQFDTSKLKKIYSKSGVTVYYGGEINDAILATTKYYRIFVVNKSGKAVTLTAKDVSANDYSMSAYLSVASCPDNSVAGGRLAFYSYEMRENNITDIKKISFKLTCYNSTDLSYNFSSGWTSEKITISV